MNRQQAIAITLYLKRAHEIVPTTGAEWEIIRGAFPMIESIANGLAQCTMAAIVPPKAPE